MLSHCSEKANLIPKISDVSHHFLDSSSSSQFFWPPGHALALLQAIRLSGTCFS